ncbi:outer membrane protein assembly factor BamA [Lentisphaerota bacterium WC36G]|nr:outer membrane protein assembly factor BamA [Lentisphaerae bacterium WC36]
MKKFKKCSKKMVLSSLLSLGVVGANEGFAAKIKDIIFEQTSQFKFEKKTLMFNISERAGDEYDVERANEDLKRLKEMGFFRNLKYDLIKHEDGDVSIKFILESRAVVVNVEISGNKEVTSKDLLTDEVVPIALDMPLQDAQLSESLKNIEKLYKAKGYNDAKVTYRRENNTDGTLNIHFYVKENLRIKVDNVTFENSTVYSDYTLKDSIATRYNILSRFLEFGLYDPKELLIDKARLAQLYHEKGYLDFKVEKITTSQSGDDPSWMNVKFTFFEGKPYIVNSVSIKGNKAVPTETLQKRLKLKLEKPYCYSDTVNDKRVIEEEYDKLGYADVTIKAVPISNYVTHRVDVVYEITEGRPYTVKRVNISGNRITQDYVIRRELAIQNGDPVDNFRIEQSRKRLMGMGYFEDVKAAAVNSNRIGEKDVNFEVKEKPFVDLQLGAGASDYNSLVGTVKLSSPNVDIFNPQNNFLGGGQRLNLSGYYGLERAGAELSFTEPWLFGIPLALTPQAYVRDYNYDYWRENHLGGNISLGYTFEQFMRVTARYRMEWVDVDEISSGASPELRDQEDINRISEFLIRLERDTRDEIILEPTSGHYIMAEGAINAKIMGGSFNYYRLNSRASYHYSLFDKAIRLHARGQLGTVSNFNINDEVPIYERYFLGGGNSLRGFEFMKAGVADSNDHAIGGNTIAFASLEATHPIWKFIRGAAFIDAGSIWRNPYEISFNTLNVGAGYGLRVLVPYLNAPVRLDVAYPIVNNSPDAKNRIQFHFNVGFTW